MKIALAHDYLNQWGGAEKVLEILAETFPEAPIYTLMYDREKTFGKFDKKIAGASFLDFEYARKNHRRFIPLMPLAARFLKIPDKYDLVISSSAGFGKGFSIGKKTKHIAYTHTPLRYAWEQEEYLSNLITNNQLLIIKPILNYLKKWDWKMGQKPDTLIANSEFIAEKIKKYYGRDSTVIYPPVDLDAFYPSLPTTNQPAQADYFLALGRFLHYKKFDLVIEAFNKLGLPLKIVGAGPEEANLKSKILNLKNIELIPFVDNQDKLRELYQNARATIFPQVEDFGLVAAESVACGTPVIAYNAGGAKEIVNSNSGLLFSEQNSESLAKTVKDFIKRENDFKPERVRAEALKFSKESFKNKITEVLHKI